MNSGDLQIGSGYSAKRRYGSAASAICVQILKGEKTNRFEAKIRAFINFYKNLLFFLMIYQRFIFVQVAAPSLATGASDELYRAYVSFEKQHGDRDAIEEVG